MKKHGHYFHGYKEYSNANGQLTLQSLKNRPCIDISGSVIGMRKLYWGDVCDVVRVGSYIYKAN